MENNSKKPENKGLLTTFSQDIRELKTKVPENRRNQLDQLITVLSTDDLEYLIAVAQKKLMEETTKSKQKEI